MPCIAYTTKRFSADRLDLIATLNTVIAAYQAKGHQLTLRQLYYQCIAHDLFPDDWADDEGKKNLHSNYKRMCSLVSDARRAGLIDWSAIVDLTRDLEHNAHWKSPSDVIDSVTRQYRVDRWESQEARPEVWVEKDALVGIVARVCRVLDVPWFSTRGYASDSELWSHAQRFADLMDRGFKPWVLHLSDHDPSGVNMTDDIKNRLGLFMSDVFQFRNGQYPRVRRLGLTMDQIDELKPPPNPAKQSDSRFKQYEELYGDESWELDALPPEYLEDLILRHVLSFITNKQAWETTVTRERHDLQQLALMRDNWNTAVGNIIATQPVGTTSFVKYPEDPMKTGECGDDQ